MIPGRVINRDHILTTLSRIDREGVPTINQSRGVELHHNGRRYPPKYVISLAFEVAAGRVLPLADFITTEAEYRLRGLGFFVTRTPEHQLADLDADMLAVGAPTAAHRPVELETSRTAAKETVYLVSCVKTKRTNPAPARDLFISPWFVGVRELVEQSGSLWFVLSTQYGLVSPNEIVSPYDRTLNTMGVYERREWASRVKAQMEQRLPPAKRIIVFAGRRYHEFLLDYLRRKGAFVETPFGGLTRGQQLAWLANHRIGKTEWELAQRKEVSFRAPEVPLPLIVGPSALQNASDQSAAAAPGADWQPAASLDAVELDPEVRKLAEETINFFEQSPEASIRSGRATLIAIVRKMGAHGTLDQAIRELENSGKISYVTAIQMHTIQKIRNKVEYDGAHVTSDDAKTCAVALVTILKSITLPPAANVSN